MSPALGISLTTKQILLSTSPIVMKFGVLSGKANPHTSDAFEISGGNLIERATEYASFPDLIDCASFGSMSPDFERKANDLGCL